MRKRRQPPWVGRPTRVSTQNELRVPCVGHYGESLEIRADPDIRETSLYFTLRNRGHYLCGDVSFKDALALADFIKRSVPQLKQAAINTAKAKVSRLEAGQFEDEEEAS